MFLKGNKINLGRKHTQEHIDKVRLKNLGKKRPKQSKKMLGRIMSEESKLKISKALKGKLKGRTPWNKGLKMEERAGELNPSKRLEIRKKISESKKGSKNPNWKGGVSSINLRIRGSLEYRLWREAVFQRDNYTCIWCGARNGEGKNITLHADHIKQFAFYPELRFAIDNGRTLCKKCHMTTDTYCKKTI